MADENKPDTKATEDLTPTPTQAEMDEIMAKLTNTEVVKKAEAKDTTKDLPPTMTQAENDAAHKAARPGDVPPEGSTDPQSDRKSGAEADAEEQKRKALEADKPAGYQTRSAKPTK